MYIEVKILQLIQFILETNNNDIYVRDLESQMQKFILRTSLKHFSPHADSNISRDVSDHLYTINFWLGQFLDVMVVIGKLPISNEVICVKFLRDKDKLFFDFLNM